MPPPSLRERTTQKFDRRQLPDCQKPTPVRNGESLEDATGESGFEGQSKIQNLKSMGSPQIERRTQPVGD